MGIKLTDASIVELSTAPVDGDLCYIVDVSDTSQDAAGTSKKIQFQYLNGALIGGASTLHYHASDRALGNATGTLAIANGGTNSTTAQGAIDTLTAVSGATEDQTIKKDSSGNATWANSREVLTANRDYYVRTG